MFGISTYCLHRSPLDEALDRIIGKTDMVEVMDDGPHFLESAAILESYNARFFFHAPCRSVNIASSLEPIRRASVEVLGQCFDVAAEVNAPVVIHPGYFTWRDEQPRALFQFKKSLSELHGLANERSVTFFIENMGNWDYFFIRHPSELSLLEGYGLALDIGHAHLNGCLAEFLEVPIAHFHLHDNNGKEDSHAPVGGGTIDFAPVMRAVQKNGVVPIIEVETFEGVLTSIVALQKMSMNHTG